MDGACYGVAIIVHIRIEHQRFSSFDNKIFETFRVSVATKLVKHIFISDFGSDHFSVKFKNSHGAILNPIYKIIILKLTGFYIKRTSIVILT